MGGGAIEQIDDMSDSISGCSLLSDLSEAKDFLSLSPAPQDDEGHDETVEELLLKPDYSLYNFWSTDCMPSPLTCENLLESGLMAEFPTGCVMLQDSLQGVGTSLPILQTTTTVSEHKDEEQHSLFGLQLFSGDYINCQSPSTSACLDMVANQMSISTNLRDIDLISFPSVCSPSRLSSSIAPMAEQDSPTSLGSIQTYTQQSVTQVQSMQQSPEQDQSNVTSLQTTGSSVQDSHWPTVLGPRNSCISGLATSNGADAGGEVSSPPRHIKPAKKKGRGSMRNSRGAIFHEDASLCKPAGCPLSSGSAGKRRHSEAAVNIFRKWIHQHKNCMRPSRDAQSKLATSTGLTEKQVYNWFCYVRSRASRVSDDSSSESDMEEMTSLESMEQVDSKQDASEQVRLGCTKRRRTKAFMSTQQPLSQKETAVKAPMKRSGDEPASEKQDGSFVISEATSTGRLDYVAGIKGVTSDFSQSSTVRKRTDISRQLRIKDKINDRDDSQSKNTRFLPESAVAVLKKWLQDQGAKVIPSKDMKDKLAEQTGLTKMQVANWFYGQHRQTQRTSSKNGSAFHVT